MCVALGDRYVDNRSVGCFYCGKIGHFTDSLQKELEAFLSAQPGRVSLAVTTQDLCRFA